MSAPDWIGRFEAKVIPEPNSGCWLWTGAVNEKGYGKFNVGGNRHGGTVRRAHRLAYEAYVGPIPDGILVLHKCDTPSCVRPDHLRLGSAADNTLDMVKKCRGKNGFTKLTEDEVIAIRASKDLLHRELADMFGVTRSAIGKIRGAKTWAHI